MEDNFEDLKSIVTQTLDSKGVLGRIRVAPLHARRLRCIECTVGWIALQAMLRASVFQAIDDQEKAVGVSNIFSTTAVKMNESPEGSPCLAVRYSSLATRAKVRQGDLSASCCANTLNSTSWTTP